ncbi:MAG: outer membrane beta-barrel protein [Gammaproteobacteria bacterium]
MALATGAGAQEGFDSARSSAELRATGAFIDNFYYNTGTEPQESAMGVLVTPRASYKATKGRLDILAMLEGEFAEWDTEGPDGYEDVRAGASTSWLATRRGRLDLRGGFERSHDPFGTNRTEDATVRDRELDLWHALQAGLLYHYGAPEATLNTETGLSIVRKTYQTNEADTRFLDFDATTFQYTVFYNVTAKTAVLFDFKRIDVQFDEPFGAVDGRSGNEYRVRTGLRWLATGKTSGDLRIGTYRRDFDQVAAGDEGLDWEATLKWAPRARSLLELEAARNSQESYRSDTNVNITRATTLRWKQYWGVRLGSNLSATHANTEFVGLGRKDTLYNVRLGLDYMLTRSLSAVMSADSFTRTSNVPNDEFDRFSLYAGVRLEY